MCTYLGVCINLRTTTGAAKTEVIRKPVYIVHVETQMIREGTFGFL